LIPGRAIGMDRLGTSEWKPTIVEALACRLVDENTRIRRERTDEEESGANNKYFSEDLRAVLE